MFLQKSIIGFILIVPFLLAAQDTTSVQVFTWDQATRRMTLNFPDDPATSYRKILMRYNMRCHNAAVGNGNVGCYEWDYSCNTFVTDSSRLDSTPANSPSHIITGNSGFQFYFTSIPTYSYYHKIQKQTAHARIVSENTSNLGNNGSARIWEADGRARYQFLYTANELTAAGFSSGNVNGLVLNAREQTTLPHCKIRMKQIPATELNPNAPELEGLTEVYYVDTDVKQGANKLYFHTAFTWDGSSSVLIELSYTDLNLHGDPVFSSQPASGKAIESTAKEPSVVLEGIAAKMQGGKLSRFNDEITVSFWAFGTAHFQPSNGSILEANNSKGQRALNIHLPWGNGSIYFDCGGQDGSYDRIEKQANVSDYEGQWVHWAFTKNAQTGEMKIYKNGVLWQSGTAKTKTMELSQFSLGDGVNGTVPFYGRIRELSIWNKALDQQTLVSWKNKSISAQHPDYDRLIYYFDMNEPEGDLILDKAKDPQDLQLPVALRRFEERGENNTMNFKSVDFRPDIGLLRGSYTGTTTTMITVLDSIPANPRKVLQYKVLNNNRILDSTYYLYYAGEDYIHLDNGNNDGTIFIEPEDLIDIVNLNYYNKFPAKFELLSLVTPYGNGLDLGKDGKTFVFDVTDFSTVLKGRKTISMELGGENQEEIDLRFLFIKGIPERKVRDISNIWPFQRGYFGDILANKIFEPRTFPLPVQATHYKLRFSVTGHEQNGEFTPRDHFVTVNSGGSKKFPFTVWKECAYNPIYPQGGTWIFDRAGWCPGAPSELFTFEIGNLVNNSKNISFDYGLEPPTLGSANYLVSSQLVSYDDYAFDLDASIEEIIRPQLGRVEFERLNPSCNKPTIRIRNSGKQELRSVKIRYGMKNRLKEEFIWNGSLASSQMTDIELPVSSKDFWTPGPDSLYIFEAELIEANQQTDGYASNNRLETPFKPVDRYPGNLAFEFRTNNVPQDNNYKIVDKNGTVVLSRDQMTANTTYRDELMLPEGCYTLYVNDASNDGLYFWYYASNGNGVARMMRKFNATYLPVKQFNPDFGAAVQYDFVITGPVGTGSIEQPSLLSIYPNPANEQLFVSYEDAGSGFLNWQIVQLDGRIVREGKSQASQNKFRERIDLHALAPGNYLIKLIHDQKILVRKFTCF